MVRAWPSWTDARARLGPEADPITSPPAADRGPDDRLARRPAEIAARRREPAPRLA